MEFSNNKLKESAVSIQVAGESNDGLDAGVILPVEMWKEIFSYLSTTTDVATEINQLKDYRCVCKMWKGLLDEDIIIKLGALMWNHYCERNVVTYQDFNRNRINITNGGRFHTLVEQFYNTNINPFSTFIVDISLMNDDEVPNERFTSGMYLFLGVFGNGISSLTYQLNSNFTKEELYNHIQLIFTKIPTLLNLCLLDHTTDDIDFQAIMEQMQNEQEKTGSVLVLPKLKRLIVDIIYMPRTNSIMIAMMMKLYEMIARLKYLSYGMYYVEDEECDCQPLTEFIEYLDKIPGKLIEQMKISIPIFENSNNIPFINSGISIPKLKHLIIESCYLENLFLLSNEFICKCPLLTELTLTLDRHLNLEQTEVYSSVSTLFTNHPQLKIINYPDYEWKLYRDTPYPGVVRNPIYYHG